MKRFYLIAAIVGAVVPYCFFILFIRESGLDLAAFARALFANGAAGGFSADLLIASFVFWGFMLTRCRTGGPRPGWFIVLNLTIGLSCALPAYLYWQERQTDRIRSGG